jgi:hypothetical protein
VDVVRSLSGQPPHDVLAWLHWRWYAATGLEATVQRLSLLGLLTPTGLQPWAAPLADGDLQAAAAALTAALPPEQDDAVVQADGTAVVAGRPSGALRALLQAVAVRESERTWRVDADRVRAALDAGSTADALVERLRTASRHPLPQPVEQLVRDVGNRHGLVQVVPSATLLRVADEPLQEMLLRDKALKGLGLAAVAPGLLSSAKPPVQVMAALRAAGHAPIGPADKARRRPAGRSAALPEVAVADPAAVVRGLRRGTSSPPPLPPAPAPLARGRFDHLPPREQLLLARALSDGRDVEIDYVAASGRRTTRVVGDLQDTGHLLVGWCRLRDDERMFSPEGIRAVRPGG